MARDDHAGLPAELRRERDDGRARADDDTHHRQQLRRHQRGGAPDAAGDPPGASRTARCADRGHRVRGAARPGKLCARCPKSTRFGPATIRLPGAPRAGGPAPQGQKLRRGADRMRPSLHLLFDLAGARAVAVGAVRRRCATRWRANWTAGAKEIVLTGVDITDYGGRARAAVPAPARRSWPRSGGCACRASTASRSTMR